MTETIFWMSGNEPTNDRDKNLLASQRRAHTARISHLRRKAALAQKKVSTVYHEHILDFNDTNVTVAKKQPDWPRKSVAKKPPVTTDEVISEDETSVQAWQAGSSPSSDSTGSVDSSIAFAITKQPRDQISAVLEQPYQRRAFHIWVHSISHRVAIYGLHAQTMFVKMIPRLSLNSPALRHMVLAYSNGYEMKRKSGDEGALYMTRSNIHYNAGLQAMCQAKSLDNDFLAAVAMAYLTDALRDNPAASIKHAKGFENLLVNFTGAHDADYMTLKGCHTHMKIMGELMAFGKVPDPTLQPASIEQSRTRMLQIIHGLEEYAATKDPNTLHEWKTCLGQWFNADREWIKTQEVTTNRQAVLLLMHFAITLVPPLGGGEHSASSHSEQHTYMLSTANEYLERMRHLDAGERKQLIETLTLLVACIERNVEDPRCRTMTSRLEQRLRSSEMWL